MGGQGLGDEDLEFQGLGFQGLVCVVSLSNGTQLGKVAAIPRAVPGAPTIESRRFLSNVLIGCSASLFLGSISNTFIELKPKPAW